MDSTLLYNQVIDSKVAKKIFNIINKQNGTCCFWKDDKCYFNREDGYSDYYIKLTGIKPIFIENINDDLFININKFIWFDTIENLEVVQKEYLFAVEGINYFKSHSNLLEIVPTNVSKGNTLKVLIEQLGIKQNEVIAIGDDENDISMIKFAGLGVAMGNAKDSVKNISDYITTTNEKNGVGKVINKYIL
jgi:Cof subfamily protein (haloacid dehalogenase superfamily)